MRMSWRYLGTLEHAEGQVASTKGEDVRDGKMAYRRRPADHRQRRSLRPGKAHRGAPTMSKPDESDYALETAEVPLVDAPVLNYRPPDTT